MWGWYLSSTAILLISSWTIHNIVSWMKCRPFLQPRGQRIFIGTVAFAQLYWVLELYANFAYFNGGHGRLFNTTRPFEPLFRYASHPFSTIRYSLLNTPSRDPWWIFTTANLFWNIRYRYSLTLTQIVRVSPRFAILLFSMCLSIIFIILEVLAVTPVFSIGGINPYWKFASVFKCFTDTVILDDFKSALDKLSHHRMNMINNVPFGSNHTGVNYRWYAMNQTRPRAATSSSERAVLASTEHVEQLKTEGAETASNDNPKVVALPPSASIRGERQLKEQGSIELVEHA